MESRLGTVMVNFTPKPQDLSATLLSCPFMSHMCPSPLPLLFPSQALSRVTSSDGGGGSPGCSSRMPGNLETKAKADLYREPL